MPDLSVPAVVAGLVAILCAIIAIAAWRATIRTGNRGIMLVSYAFAIQALKATAKSTNLFLNGEETQTLEILFSLMDLAAVLLIAWPILRHRSS